MYGINSLCCGHASRCRSTLAVACHWADLRPGPQRLSLWQGRLCSAGLSGRLLSWRRLRASSRLLCALAALSMMLGALWSCQRLLLVLFCVPADRLADRRAHRLSWPCTGCVSWTRLQPIDKRWGRQLTEVTHPICPWLICFFRDILYLLPPPSPLHLRVIAFPVRLEHFSAAKPGRRACD